MRFTDLTDCVYVHGWKIVRCPECGKEYRNHVYGYVDVTGMLTWSDGYIRAGLYTSWPSVTKCECGALFLKAKASCVGYVPRVMPGLTGDEPQYEVPYLLMTEEEQAKYDEAWGRKTPAGPWWKRLFRRGPAVEYRTPTRPRPPERKKEERQWPQVPYMDSAEIEAEFARTTDFADRELETALRRDYWWSRNWKRRWPEKQIPLDGTEQDNLRRLLELLRHELAHPRPDDDGVDEAEQRASKFWLEMGEIQRELGLFDEALASFARVGDEIRGRAAQLEWLAAEQQAQLVKLNLPVRDEE